jgi:hypothetical protein
MKSHVMSLAATMLALILVSCSQSGPQITSPDPAGAIYSKGSSPATTYEVTVPEELIYNPCCDEWMSFSGTLRGVVRESNDANGGGHTIWIEHTARWTGLGLTTGIEYVPVAASPESHYMSSGTSGSTDTFIIRERAVAKGGGCTIIVNYHMKATVNANGDLVVTIEKITIECPNA